MVTATPAQQHKYLHFIKFLYLGLVMFQHWLQILNCCSLCSLINLHNYLLHSLVHLHNYLSQCRYYKIFLASLHSCLTNRGLPAQSNFTNLYCVFLTMKKKVFWLFTARLLCTRLREVVSACVLSMVGQNSSTSSYPELAYFSIISLMASFVVCINPF